mmetsp:Transcript_4926/g.13727  ORF Transcript_4926/g.13727 Transcript_4926/m.13727 type:complete len:357 (-) Transcript_4926:1-1071(-)
MVVLGRIDWYRTRALAGHVMSVQIGWSGQTHKTKVRLSSLDTPGVTAPAFRTRLVAIIDLVRMWCLDSFSHAVDRGHQHTDGRSLSIIWLQSCGIDDRVTTAGSDGRPPLDDDDDDDGVGPDGGNTDRGGCSRGDKSSRDKAVDPWSNGRDPWSLGGASKKPRHHSLFAAESRTCVVGCELPTVPPFPQCFDIAPNHHCLEDRVATLELEVEQCLCGIALLLDHGVAKNIGEVNESDSSSCCSQDFGCCAVFDMTADDFEEVATNVNSGAEEVANNVDNNTEEVATNVISFWEVANGAEEVASSVNNGPEEFAVAGGVHDASFDSFVAAVLRQLRSSSNAYSNETAVQLEKLFVKR